MLLDLEARVDSALVWALVLDRLRRGLGPAEALADTIRALRESGVTGRFNLLLTDGQVIAATTAGDTLWYRSGPGAVVVASEPSDDDEPGWTRVPEDSVVRATPARADVTCLNIPAPNGRIATR
jgi:glutamine amidotransferase